MKLGKKESEFLSKNEVCRLATIGEEGFRNCFYLA
jgi:nitroimidazol reductase NimA-like FMN-containing flavoprotein (pyridoxamine 5'-phosphate oxidase superfamily)